MSLQQVKKELASISGVKQAKLLDTEPATLQVIWFGEPSDYSTEVRDLREKYPSITQVEPPSSDLPTRTGDAMPILYYQDS